MRPRMVPSPDIYLAWVYLLRWRRHIRNLAARWDTVEDPRSIGNEVRGELLKSSLPFCFNDVTIELLRVAENAE